MVDRIRRPYRNERERQIHAFIEANSLSLVLQGFIEVCHDMVKRAHDEEREATAATLARVCGLCTEAAALVRGVEEDEQPRDR